MDLNWTTDSAPAPGLYYIPLTTSSNPWSNSLNYAPPTLTIIATLLVLFVLLTIFGNALVVVALHRFPHLRTVSNYLIGNLAASDLLLAVAVLPLSSLNECLGRWVLGRAACDLWLVSDVLCCTASIWNLCFIAFDRFTATRYPVWYREKRSTKQAVIYIACIWTISTVVCVPPLLGWSDLTDNYVFDNATLAHQCVLFQTPSYVLYSASGSFFLPFLLTLALYVAIFASLRLRVRRIRRRDSAGSVMGVAGVTGATGGETSPRRGSYSSRPLLGQEWVRSCVPCCAISRCCKRMKRSKSSSLCAAQCVPASNGVAIAESGTASNFHEFHARQDSAQECLGGAVAENTSSLVCTRSATGSTNEHCSVESEPVPDCSSIRAADTSDCRTSTCCFASAAGAASDGQESLCDAVHAQNDLSAEDATTGRATPCSPTGRVSFCLASHSSTESLRPAPRCEGGMSDSRARIASQGPAHVIGSEWSHLSESTTAATLTSLCPHLIERRASDLEGRGGPRPRRASGARRGGSERFKTRSPQSASNRATGRRASRRDILAERRSSSAQRAEQRELRATLRMAVIIGAFCLMWLGFFLLYSLRGLAPPLGAPRRPVPRQLDAFLFWLGYSNSCVNPVLYTVFNDDFKRAFARILTGGQGGPAGVRRGSGAAGWGEGRRKSSLGEGGTALRKQSTASATLSVARWFSGRRN